jgi:hypothetical protein
MLRLASVSACEAAFRAAISLDIALLASDTLAAGTAVETPSPILVKVLGPTIPSSVRPFAFCHALTAASVLGPKLPVGSTPNFS